MAGTQRSVRCLLVALLLACLGWPAHGQKNLLDNGGFESGAATPWSGASSAEVTAEAARTGAHGLRLSSAQLLSQGWVSVTPGTTYVLTGWFKWTAFAGDEWGYDLLDVVDANWQPEASLTHLSARFPRGQWVKLALTFVATTAAVQVRVGVYGPKATIEQAWDDLALVEKRGNLPPTLSPTASTTSGVAPLTVEVAAHAADIDGAIAVVSWDFGDGAVATSEQATHTFTTRGTHTVQVTAWDNDGVQTTETLTVVVLDDANPAIAVASPTAAATHETDAQVLTLSGTASAPDGRSVQSIVWDNLDTDEAGVVDVRPAARLAWRAEAVRLKAGRNELLVTTTDSSGRIATARLLVTRTAAAPAITNVTLSPATVRMYEKVEVTFDLETVARHPMFRYDPAPPPGVVAGTGVTVEAVIVAPSGVTRVQPGYLHGEVIASQQGAGRHVQETGRASWRVRFSAMEVGAHAVSLRVEDASGRVEVPVGTVTASAASRPGFIGVSAADPRYFQFSNGDLYYPVGPAHGPDYTGYGGDGVNLERPWMAGQAAYSTNWSRWMRVDLPHGNEGVDSPLTFADRFPGHELSRELYAPGAHRIWMGAWQDEAFFPQLVAGRRYLIKLRLKTVGITGPAEAGRPYGFMVKTHAFPTETIEADLASRPSLIPAVQTDRGWHTVVVPYTATSHDTGGYLSLLLENVTGGHVYIDQFSIRERLRGGSLGGELIRQARADLHTYVEARPAAYFDWQVEQGEQHGVFFKFVVQDKRDWVPNHLTRVGTFAERGDGYFQAEGTKAAWLQQQWWRYLVARWGYSTAVHSWESCNEADPNDRNAWRHTQTFARVLRETNAHPQLATTSFWCCWVPEFWGDETAYPDVAYADLHEYTDDTPFGIDMAAWVLHLAERTRETPVGKPVMLGETGIGTPGQVYFEQLKAANPGIWYHNLLWAQLNGGSGLTVPNYWWGEHLAMIDREAIARPFVQFVKHLDVHRGGYVDVQATSSNGELRALGQKHVGRGAAYLWIQNRRHTWHAVMHAREAAPRPQSGTITVRLAANASYLVERWNTYGGGNISTETLVADASGDLALSVSDLVDDIAVRVRPAVAGAPNAPSGADGAGR